MARGKKFRTVTRFNTANHIPSTEEIEALLNGVFARMNSHLWRSEPVPYVRITNPQHYVCAFVHSSYLQEQTELAARSSMPTMVPPEDYQRLEFLGDSILNSIITWWLYEIFQKDADEHLMTRMRIRLVKCEQLASFARHLGMQKYALISSYMETLNDKGQGRNSLSLLEDIFEAFIGAIVCDFGFDAGLPIARNFVIGIFEECINLTDIVNNTDNFKGSLEQYWNGRRWGKPAFVEVARVGPQNDSTFYMVLCVTGSQTSALKPSIQLNVSAAHVNVFNFLLESDIWSQVHDKMRDLVEVRQLRCLSIGVGKSKIVCEQEASKHALALLEIDPNFPLDTIENHTSA